MVAAGKLVAWIEPGGDGTVIGAFIGETRSNCRQPARRHFEDAAEARRWVEEEAAALRLDVLWDEHHASVQGLPVHSRA